MARRSSASCRRSCPGAALAHSPLVRRAHAAGAPAAPREGDLPIEAPARRPRADPASPASHHPRGFASEAYTLREQIHLVRGRFSRRPARMAARPGKRPRAPRRASPAVWTCRSRCGNGSRSAWSSLRRTAYRSPFCAGSSTSIATTSSAGKSSVPPSAQHRARRRGLHDLRHGCAASPAGASRAQLGTVGDADIDAERRRRAAPSEPTTASTAWIGDHFLGLTVRTGRADADALISPEWSPSIAATPTGCSTT